MPEPPLSDDEYYNFCAANPDLRIERTSEGKIEIMPPTGLGDTHGRGISLDSNAEFFLEDGSARSPDASWIHRSKLAPLTKKGEAHVSTPLPRLRYRIDLPFGPSFEATNHDAAVDR